MAKQTPSEKSTSLAATWRSGAVGTGGAIATSLADDALVLMKTTKYGKYYESAKLVVESTAGLILNEGLEVSKDGEKGGWSDGYLDFAEDVALTVGGNYLGVLAAGFFLGTSAPVLATAAVGVGTATLVSGLYSWGKDKIPDYYNQPEEQTTAQQGANLDTHQENNQTQTPQNQQVDNWGSTFNAETGEWTDGTGDSAPSQDSSSSDDWGSTFNAETGEWTDGTGDSPPSQDSSSSDDWGSTFNAETGEWTDGTSGDQEETDDSDPTASQQPNPMNDNGDASDYDGRHDDLRGFQGEIDYGPAGKSGEGYNGEHDLLTGVNPRIDYRPDGKPGKNYAGEHDDLIGFDGSLDWGQDHSGKREFNRSPLTEILGGINPRAGLTELSTNDVVAMISFNDPLLA